MKIEINEITLSLDDRATVIESDSERNVLCLFDEEKNHQIFVPTFRIGADGHAIPRGERTRAANITLGLYFPCLLFPSC